MGYQRIQGELLRLRVEVSATAIRTTLRRHGLDPAPRSTATTWRAFLRQQAAGIVPCDFFTVALGSGRVDRNRAMTTDFGQWKVGDDMPLTDADKKWLQKEIRDAVNQHADALFRFADHGGKRPTASPKDHPHRHTAILDMITKIERRLPPSS